MHLPRGLLRLTPLCNSTGSPLLTHAAHQRACTHILCPACFACIFAAPHPAPQPLCPSQVSKGVPSPPLVVDALIGALNLSTKHTLVDIGSGLGYFSLAAAARGFKAIAFEASPRSLQPIVASIRFNGFQDRIRLYNVSLGARPEGICTAAVDPTAMPPAVSAADLGSSAGGLLHWRKHRQPLGGNFGDGVEREVRYDTEAMRGYSSPDLHALPQSACTRYTSRETLDRMLRVALSEDGLGGAGPGGQSGSQGSSQGSPSSSSSGWGGGVGALRLSANGWEGWVLDGAARLMIESPPGVVLLEYSPLLVSASGYAEPSLILYKLLTLGYKSAAHSG